MPHYASGLVETKKPLNAAADLVEEVARYGQSAERDRVRCVQGTMAIAVTV